MTASSPTDRAYAGLRVLDFSMFLAGPYCTRLMADMGAEIIKVEPPEGDFLRAAPPLREGSSAYFAVMNCGKKSISVDLKTPSGLDLVKALIATADVILENYRPGVMARLGLDYPVAAAIKPDIVYCSVSGYGQSGPRSNRPSFAPIVHAASGFDMLLPRYDPDIERPIANRYVVADCLAAVHALGGIGAALYRRTTTGKGDHLDVAMMDAMHAAMSYEYTESQFPGTQGPIVFRPMRTRDGFVAIAPVSEGNFAGLARAASHPEWLTDPQFRTRAGRVENWSQLLDAVEAWAATTTSAEAEAALLSEGCPASSYQTVGESRADPHVAFRGSAVEVRDSAGPIMAPNCPIQFTHCQAAAEPKVPELGEHTDELLSSLGYSRAGIEQLRAQGALTA